MTVTNELMYEVLKDLQRTLARHSGEFSDLKAELRGMRAHDAGFMAHEVVQDTAIADLRQRLERVERRLELRDS